MTGSPLVFTGTAQLHSAFQQNENYPVLALVQQLIIDQTYHGPPNSGNGGYCCGRFAQLLGTSDASAIEVTLRNPIPLEVPLLAKKVPQGMVIEHNDLRIAELRETSLALDILPAPSLEATKRAEAGYVGFKQHSFPGCFVCGPERREGEGLRVFAGPVVCTPDTITPGTSTPKATNTPGVAAVWRPYPALAGTQGWIREEFLWAALDCPGYFGAFWDREPPTALLGRQSVSVLDKHLSVDEQYLIQAWPLSATARKHVAATAIYRLDGECVAIAETVWITV